ncbi:MAG: toxin HigB-2 [Halobacteriovoraceae bacterium]|nr:toxin HigB-2 [Halobacteriovoraceae bacterium]|tara:strand:+ start:445 stop:795 length:351 start_codon:yes stop_codon:yes gene_type:complete
MIRTFVETDIFKTLVDQENDKSLEATIKNDILENPSRGDVISGTGGVRKFRVSDKSRGKGKRGGFRVLYVDLPKCEKTYLLFLYNKDELENISSDQKKALKKIVEGVKNECEKKKN